MKNRVKVFNNGNISIYNVSEIISDGDGNIKKVFTVPIENDEFFIGIDEKGIKLYGSLTLEPGKDKFVILQS